MTGLPRSLDICAIKAHHDGPVLGVLPGPPDVDSALEVAHSHGNHIMLAYRVFHSLTQKLTYNSIFSIFPLQPYVVFWCGRGCSLSW
jgi:hypothetical protein